MRVVSLNLNGIRAAQRKGLNEWIAEHQADVYCFQEIKADRPALEQLAWPAGYMWQAFPAEKKGYSGSLILSRVEPTYYSTGIGDELMDSEGRVQVADIAGYRIVNAYFPSGTTGDVRQAEKERFLDLYYSWLPQQQAADKPLILAGDFNICHKAIDIHDPVRNKNVSGFLPHEREWMTKLLGAGYVDSFRQVCTEPHHYTWWSYRAGAKSKNKGWRIDYLLLSDFQQQAILNHRIHSQYDFSDHCPLELILDH